MQLLFHEPDLFFCFSKGIEFRSRNLLVWNSSYYPVAVRNGRCESLKRSVTKDHQKLLMKLIVLGRTAMSSHYSVLNPLLTNNMPRCTSVLWLLPGKEAPHCVIVRYQLEKKKNCGHECRAMYRNGLCGRRQHSEVGNVRRRKLPPPSVCCYPVTVLCVRAAN